MDNPIERVVNPMKVLFSQTWIKITFDKPHDQTRIDNAARLILNGRLSPRAFPPMLVVEFQSRLWSLSNRRLWVFRTARVTSVKALQLQIDYNRPHASMLTTSPYLFSTLSNPEHFPAVKGDIKDPKEHLAGDDQAHYKRRGPSSFLTENHPTPSSYQSVRPYKDLAADILQNLAPSLASLEETTDKPAKRAKYKPEVPTQMFDGVDSEWHGAHGAVRRAHFPISKKRSFDDGEPHHHTATKKASWAEKSIDLKAFEPASTKLDPGQEAATRKAPLTEKSVDYRIKEPASTEVYSGYDAPTKKASLADKSIAYKTLEPADTELYPEQEATQRHLRLQILKSINVKQKDKFKHSLSQVQESDLMQGRDIHNQSRTIPDPENFISTVSAPSGSQSPDLLGAAIRGRPTCSRRGRPPKSRAQPPAQPEQFGPSITEKRTPSKRGRPRKSDLRLSVPRQVSSGSNGDLQVPAPSESPELPGPELIQKRKRGRPRKSEARPVTPGLSLVQSKVDLQGSAPSHVQSPELSGPEIIQRRTRGRPPKSRALIIRTSSSDEDEDLHGSAPSEVLSKGMCGPTKGDPHVFGPPKFQTSGLSGPTNGNVQLSAPSDSQSPEVFGPSKGDLQVSAPSEFQIPELYGVTNGALPILAPAEFQSPKPSESPELCGPTSGKLQISAQAELQSPQLRESPELCGPTTGDLQISASSEFQSLEVCAPTNGDLHVSVPPEFQSTELSGPGIIESRKMERPPKPQGLPLTVGTSSSDKDEDRRGSAPSELLSGKMCGPTNGNFQSSDPSEFQGSSVWEATNGDRQVSASTDSQSTELDGHANGDLPMSAPFELQSFNVRGSPKMCGRINGNLRVSVTSVFQSPELCVPTTGNLQVSAPSESEIPELLRPDTMQKRKKGRPRMSEARPVGVVSSDEDEELGGSAPSEFLSGEMDKPSDGNVQLSGASECQTSELCGTTSGDMQVSAPVDFQLSELSGPGKGDLEVSASSGLQSSELLGLSNRDLQMSAPAEIHLPKLHGSPDPCGPTYGDLQVSVPSEFRLPELCGSMELFKPTYDGLQASAPSQIHSPELRGFNCGELQMSAPFECQLPNKCGSPALCGPTNGDLQASAPSQSQSPELYGPLNGDPKVPSSSQFLSPELAGDMPVSNSSEFQSTELCRLTNGEPPIPLPSEPRSPELFRPANGELQVSAPSELQSPEVYRPANGELQVSAPSDLQSPELSGPTIRRRSKRGRPPKSQAKPLAQEITSLESNKGAHASAPSEFQSPELCGPARRRTRSKRGRPPKSQAKPLAREMISLKSNEEAQASAPSELRSPDLCGPAIKRRSKRGRPPKSQAENLPREVIFLESDEDAPASATSEVQPPELCGPAMRRRSKRGRPPKIQAKPLAQETIFSESDEGAQASAPSELQSQELFGRGIRGRKKRSTRGRPPKSQAKPLAREVISLESDEGVQGSAPSKLQSRELFGFGIRGRRKRSKRGRPPKSQARPLPRKIMCLKSRKDPQASAPSEVQSPELFGSGIRGRRKRSKRGRPPKSQAQPCTPARLSLEANGKLQASVSSETQFLAICAADKRERRKSCKRGRPGGRPPKNKARHSTDPEMLSLEPNGDPQVSSPSESQLLALCAPAIEGKRTRSSKRGRPSNLEVGLRQESFKFSNNEVMPYGETSTRSTAIEKGDLIYVSVAAEVTELKSDVRIRGTPSGRHFHDGDLHYRERKLIIGPYEVTKVNRVTAHLEIPHDLHLKPILSLSVMRKSRSLLDASSTQALRMKVTPERILNKRIVERVRKRSFFSYLIKWDKLPASEATWESETFLDKYPHLRENCKFLECPNPFLLRNIAHRN